MNKCRVCKSRVCRWVELEKDPSTVPTDELALVLNHNIDYIEMIYRGHQGSSGGEERMYGRLAPYEEELEKRNRFPKGTLTKPDKKVGRRSKMTKQEMIAKAEGLERQAKKSKGKAKLRAERYAAKLRWMAKKANGGTKKASKVVPIKPKDGVPVWTDDVVNDVKRIAAKAREDAAAAAEKKARKNFNPNQGILPGFLEQINTARIEELVAEKLFQAMHKRVENEVVDGIRKRIMGE